MTPRDMPGAPADLVELRRRIATETSWRVRRLLPGGRTVGDLYVGAARRIEFRVELGEPIEGRWWSPTTDERGDFLDLVARLKFGGSLPRAILWARRQPGVGTPAAEVAAARQTTSKPKPHLQPGYLDAAGARLRLRGVAGDDLVFEMQGMVVVVRAMRLSARVIEKLFGSDGTPLSELFPQRAGYTRRGYDLEACQEALITGCARAGIVDPQQLARKMSIPLLRMPTR